MPDGLIGGYRWRPIAAAVGVIAIATIAFFAVSGGSATTRLPAPPHVSSAARSGHGSSTQTTLQATYTPVASAPLTNCSVSVSDPRPPQGATGETIAVLAAAGAQVRLEADYARTHSVHTASGDNTGKASFSLPIGHALPGVTVPVKATATLGKSRVECASSFTPVATLTALSAPLSPLQPLNTFLKVTDLLPGAPTVAQLPPLPPVAGKPPVTPPPTTTPGTQPPPPPPPPPPTTTTTTTTVPPTTTTTTTTVPPTTTTITLPIIPVTLPL